MKEDFLKEVREKYELYDGRKIEQAYKLATLAHEGNKRESGEPWINHCVCVAEILVEMSMDADTICAGLLHDVIDDTDTTFKQISDTINDDVCELVRGLSKVNGIKYSKDNLDETESLRRLIVAMGKDIRVILIKLADRLHNMRTVEYLPRERQLKYASETRDVFSPLAERLGLSNMHAELDDLCFKTLNPQEYNKLKDELERKYDKWQEKMTKISGVLEYVLKETGVKGRVTSRFKNFYSLYKKFQTKGTEKIYDILAFRIIVETIDDCYKVLGSAHQKYRPIPGRIKDYIASPKPNGYQSLHTTLITSDGTPFELQIRTEEMHDFCEYGIASHWSYKENDSSGKAHMLQEKLDWVKNLIEQEMQITDNKNFVKALQVDFSSAEIWVFTPKYKPISLIAGATPIDFAYEIHTELGHKCIGAKVNGKKVSLATILETGDVVEILTSNGSKGPSRDWLNIAVSQNAKYNIRLFFRRETTPENIIFGKKILEEEAKAQGLTLGDIIADDNYKELKEKFNFDSLDDMFASVACKGVTVNQILKPTLAKKETLIKNVEAINNSPILVEGNPVVSYKFSGCCSPIPGDSIVAVSSREGYSIHTADCKNLKYIGSNRYLEASWNQKINKVYNVHLSLIGKDEAGVLGKILSTISSIYNDKISFTALNAQLLPKGKFEVVISLKVKNKEELDNIINSIKQQVPNIEYISRKNIG